MLGELIVEARGKRVVRRTLSSEPLKVEVSFEDAGKVLGVDYTGLLLGLDFGATYRPMIWRVQIPQSRSDHGPKLRVQRATTQTNYSSHPNGNRHAHTHSTDARSSPHLRHARAR